MPRPRRLAEDPVLAQDIRDANRRALDRGTHALAVVGTNVAELVRLVAHLDQAAARAETVMQVERHFANLVAAARAAVESAKNRR
jgi:enamine deaminase RidA (YjgF/YER057c/UK114 family)